LGGEGLCAALNLRYSILCGDKLIGSKLYRQWNFTRCEIYLSNIRVTVAQNSVAAINSAGRVFFTTRAIRSEILNFYSAVNLMRLKILTRRRICGILKFIK